MSVVVTGKMPMETSILSTKNSDEARSGSNYLLVWGIRHSEMRRFDWAQEDFP